jgi:hypothetical protein
MADAIPAPTAANPYGLTPQLQGLMSGLGGLSSTLNQASGASANYMALTQGLGAPYGAGVGMPRASLLAG